MHPKIYGGRALRNCSKGQRFAAFVLHDGTAHLGKAVVDATRVDQPPKLYFQGPFMTPSSEKISVWCLLGSNGDGPDESWPIWQDPTVFPKKGEEIVYWDTEAARMSYSGPYWHVGTFGTDNRRYQGASGPFVSGEPWTVVKSWVKLEELICWLGLRDVPWIKSDARSGVAAFTAALQDCRVNLKGEGYAVDHHFEHYGFSFLETEEQALGFIDELRHNGCTKGLSAKSRYDSLTETGLLLRMGMTRLDIAIMALSAARRTHCGCHETGSFAPLGASINGPYRPQHNACLAGTGENA